MKSTLVVILSLCYVLGIAQNDNGHFTEYYNHFYHDSIMSDDTHHQGSARTSFKMVTDGFTHPGAPETFTTAWCQDPISQGNTGTCWCFSTTSFFEAEIFRLSGNKINLSEQYVVYYEYIEKALEFVRTRGESHFGQGSETNAVMRMMKKYGTVPHDVFVGELKGNGHHDHESMFQEMKSFLMGLKESRAWNEEFVMETIKSILDHHIGTPPASFKYEGKEYTPLTFMQEVCKLNPNDYVEFMSLKEKPYHSMQEYDVPDNWWNSAEYYNVPLNDFYKVVEHAAKKGYTISIGGDVSGPGYLPQADMAYIPTFDIPHDYINEDARMLRFENGATTDDHAIHLIGYKDTDNGRWYLVKDSGSSARNGKYDGYMMFHESYIKLKIMTLTVHKDIAVKVMK